MKLALPCDFWTPNDRITVFNAMDDLSKSMIESVPFVGYSQEESKIDHRSIIGVIPRGGDGNFKKR